ncbi:hypothetical protein GYA27_03725 [candidate division WWE3 bacterium]|uniref:Uncharacterized protein n=1 Tax=candidate division WWE3 bacterium TaxID=2053526 RepID=A0A7X9HH64_UNCKA|nr:hypothetical protein [candidate division WWE3 bacterium]
MTIGVLVIACGDGRLDDARNLLRYLLRFRQADYLTLPGAGICLEHTIKFESAADGKTHVITPDFALEQVHLYTTLHPTIQEVWVVAHHNCRATDALDLTNSQMTEGEVKRMLWPMYQKSIDSLEEAVRKQIKLFYQTLDNRIYEMG